MGDDAEQRNGPGRPPHPDHEFPGHFRNYTDHFMKRSVFRRTMVRTGDVNAWHVLLYLGSPFPAYEGKERELRFQIAKAAYFQAWAEVKQEESRDLSVA